MKCPNLDQPLEFVLSVMRKHKDPIRRLIDEAVRILYHMTMNSCSEWHGYRTTRLTVEEEERKAKKRVENIESETQLEKGEMLKSKLG